MTLSRAARAVGPRCGRRECDGRPPSPRGVASYRRVPIRPPGMERGTLHQEPVGHRLKRCGGFDPRRVAHESALQSTRRQSGQKEAGPQGPKGPERHGQVGVRGANGDVSNPEGSDFVRGVTVRHGDEPRGGPGAGRRGDRACRPTLRNNVPRRRGRHGGTRERPPSSRDQWLGGGVCVCGVGGITSVSPGGAGNGTKSRRRLRRDGGPRRP